MTFNRKHYAYSALIPRYGAPSSINGDALAIVHYCNAQPSFSLENGILHLTIPSSLSSLDEYWVPTNIRPDIAFQKESHVTGHSGWCADGENLFAAYSIPDEPELALSAQHAYEYLIGLVQQRGYTNIYRIWNYIGCINAPNSNNLERYRDFCIGRANAFEAMNYAPSTLPAATGIGFQDGGVSIFLIARKTQQALNIENPLQVPAYQYPNLYGPKAPSFARATVIDTQDGTCLYVSGTASIRQHASLTHTLEQQIAITLENIQQLVSSASSSLKPVKKYLCESLKIYVRHTQDVPLVASAFRAAFGVTAENAPVLVSDICRAELSLEVEGVFRS